MNTKVAALSHREQAIWLAGVLEAKGTFSPIGSSYLRVAIRSDKLDLVQTVAAIAEVPEDSIVATDSPNPRYLLQLMGDEAVATMRRVLWIVGDSTASIIEKQLAEAGASAPRTYGEYLVWTVNEQAKR